MNRNMFDFFLNDKFDVRINQYVDNEIIDGVLINKDDNSEIIIKNGIPRFTDNDYSDTFGFQWNLFQDLQIDSKNGNNYSEDRIKLNTKWDLNDLKGKYVLECGSGPGRFSEIFLKYGAFLVSVDMSSAIDVNRKNQNANCNHMLIQADINKLSYFSNKFDYVFCYGVLQHTPSPLFTLSTLLKYCKVKTGKLSCDVYEKSYIPKSWTFPKYAIRPFIKNISKEKLLKIIKWYVPKYIKFDTFLKQKIKGGHYIASLIPIPIYNYLDHKFTEQERVNHAIMDTFDALSPVYDNPLNKRMIENYLNKIDNKFSYDIKPGANGLVINLFK